MFYMYDDDASVRRRGMTATLDARRRKTRRQSLARRRKRETEDLVRNLVTGEP